MKSKKERTWGKGFLENLISTVELLHKDLLKFLLIIVITLIFGGPGIAVAYGCLGGIVLIISIMLFILAALYLDKTFELEKRKTPI